MTFDGGLYQDDDGTFLIFYLDLPILDGFDLQVEVPL